MFGQETNVLFCESNTTFSCHLFYLTSIDGVTSSIHIYCYITRFTLDNNNLLCWLMPYYVNFLEVVYIDLTSEHLFAPISYSKLFRHHVVQLNKQRNQTLAVLRETFKYISLIIMFIFIENKYKSMFQYWCIFTELFSH